MMGQQYKLYSNATGTNNGVASLKVVKSGRIKGILFAIGLLGGAGVSRQSWEVYKQNTGSLAVNDTPGTVIASVSVASPNAVHANENVMVLCDVELTAGDTLYINTLFSGAVAPAAVDANIYIYT